MIGRTRRRSGVSLIEIMMSFSVITVVIIAFATVFPSGYRLNYKNFSRNKAATLASSVIEELRSLDDATLSSLTASQVYGLLSTELRKNLAQGVSQTSVTVPYYLNGVRVTPASDGATLPPIRTWSIEVNVSWQETTKSGTATQSVSVASMFTNALKRTYTH